MKALACGNCGDIQALRREWRTCDCGLISARWLDPQAGSAVFRAASENAKRFGFLLCLNDLLLVPALQGELAMFSDFRDAHDRAIEAPNHVFDKSRAGCWAVVVRVGQTSDVSWEEEGA